MSKFTDDFLQILDRESRRGLDASESRALRDEIAAHLDAAIAARLELGATQEEAEREAVAEFGDVRRIVRAMREVPAPRFDPRFFKVVGTVWSALLGFAYATWYRHWDWMPMVLNLLGLATVVAIGVVAFEGMRLRRVPLLPIFALYVGFTLFGAFVHAAFMLPSPEPGRMLFRESASASLDFLARERQAILQNVATFDANHRRYLAGASVEPAGFAVHTLRMTYGRVSDPKLARDRWQTALTGWRNAELEKAQLAQSTHRDLQERLSRPWVLGAPMWVGVSAILTAVPALFTLFFTLVGMGIGRLARRRSDRRRIA